MIDLRPLAELWLMGILAGGVIAILWTLFMAVTGRRGARWATSKTPPRSRSTTVRGGTGLLLTNYPIPAGGTSPATSPTTAGLARGRTVKPRRWSFGIRG
jgi:hypothetical protein